MDDLSALLSAFHANPSPSDRPGLSYNYIMDPAARQGQWRNQCRGEQQDWGEYYEVPFAAKFERILHRHFRLEGAWLGPVRCDYCGRRHLEKFDLAAVSGRAQFQQVAEFYLGQLGWPIIKKSL
ncbi:hypothetical protein B0H17DRAFT_1204494 [Mycena rosella]|uniref:Uncharacterized protein n=1 Tax=Mycena rosella TaxID=1033263 RepID=A0AAD7GF56_MYCRO|nr:hypothetical protein B0H17DRAFT_1204494 [Mycena rosella]